MLLWDGIAIGLTALCVVSAVGWFIGGLSPTGRLVACAVLGAIMWHGTNNGSIRPGHTLRDAILKPVLGQRAATDRIMDDWADRILTDPEIGPRLKSLSNTDKKRILTEMVAHGMPRMGQPYLQQRTILINRLLEVSSVQECAAMGRGSMKSDALVSMVSRLSSQEIEQFMALAVEAARAEVRQAAYAQASNEQLGAAVQVVMSRMSQSDAERFRTVAIQVQNPAQGRDEDVCWMGKALYREVENLPSPHRETLRQGLSRWE
ncbi:MAG: hypothetical protein HZB35_00290 [Nitrospirae bacterium]|nr:hypothetical protein [Nitrospirota bacterium]